MGYLYKLEETTADDLHKVAAMAYFGAQRALLERSVAGWEKRDIEFSPHAPDEINEAGMHQIGITNAVLRFISEWRSDKLMVISCREGDELIATSPYKLFENAFGTAVAQPYGAFVRPAWRQKGVASGLSDFGAKMLKERGVSVIEVICHESSHTRKILEKRGVSFTHVTGYRML